MIRARILTAVIALTTAIACNTYAQHTLIPKWAKGAVNASNMKYSANGAVFMVGEYIGVRAWRVSDSKMIASVPVSVTDYVPSQDGSGFYYSINSSPNSLYYYKFSDRTATLLRTDAANFGAASTLALSTDGLKLAYTAYNSTTSRNNVTILNLQNNTVLKRFGLPVGVANYDLEFVYGNTRILTSGLRLYTTDGVLVGSRLSATTNLFAVSPDRTKAFARDEAAVLFAVDLTSASGLPVLWSRGNQSEVDPFLQVSADGAAFLTNGWIDDPYWNCVHVYSTADGLRLANSIYTSQNTYNGYYAASPASNEFVVLTAQTLRNIVDFNSIHQLEAAPDLRTSVKAWRARRCKQPR
jgi:hypothetical protein